MMGAGRGLYDPADERDSCGVGMVVRIDGSKGHDIVEYGLCTLENLAHRGAENADGQTGDGSGITFQIPHEFILKCGIHVPEAGRYGTGLIFLPKDTVRYADCMEVFRNECADMGLTIIAERDVPVDHTVPGRLALETEPSILQVFISVSFKIPGTFPKTSRDKYAHPDIISMTKGRLGMIVCPMLEDEAIYNIKNDPEIDDVYLVNTAFNETIIPKLRQHGVNYQTISTVKALSGDFDKDKYSVIIWVMFMGRGYSVMPSTPAW